ncbi:MAG: HEAT repeat domain-containing protein [Alphaproteobacteria bacterium]|nr:HEAT repeat domain-containing protein [Alphaproteobacteria bacterium]
MFLLAFLLGCDVVPRRIEEPSEVDKFLSMQNYASACVGLKNLDDDGLRTYTAQQLVPFDTRGDARRCLCDALYVADAHRADLAVALGVQNSKRDDLAKCFAPALSDPAVEDKDKVAEALGRIGAPAGFEALEAVVKSDADVATRAAAARSLKPSSAARHTLIEAVLNDPDPTVRAAAAEGLEGKTQDEVVSAIGKVLDDDTDNNVRAVALRSLMVAKAPGAMTKVCRTLMNDEDATMRVGAAKALHGTKSATGIACLKDRLLEKEENPAVRTAVMEALGASPSDKAADALCDLIHPVMKLYVTDKIAEETQGVDICTFQNNRDHERSYECVNRAYNKGGLSCYARNHLGRWVNDLGGKAHRPLCPGMTPN